MKKRTEPSFAVVDAVLSGMNLRRLRVWVGLSHGRGFLPRRIKVASRSKYWHVKLRIGTSCSGDLVYEASWGTGVAGSHAIDHDPRGTDWFPVKDVHPHGAIQLAKWCESRLGAGYDFLSGLRFVPWIRTLIGDRESRRDRRRYNCGKFGLLGLRAIGLEPIPRMIAFRVAPGDFLHSALLADPVNLDEPILLHAA